MRAIIVDDQSKSRNVLRLMLEQYCPNIKVISEAENVAQGVELIHKYAPELVFLDVEMPDEDGFGLLNYFAKPAFEIIFTTAHPDYALRAFEVAAIGYLLKPIQATKLMDAVEKAIKLHGQNQISERLAAFKLNLHHNEVQKIALPVSDGLLFVEVNDIIMLKACGAYTQLFLKNQKDLLISKNLKEFEGMLSKHPSFIRTHRSYIINMNYLLKYNKSEGGFIELSNDLHAEISKDKKTDFDNYIKN